MKKQVWSNLGLAFCIFVASVGCSILAQRAQPVMTKEQQLDSAISRYTTQELIQYLCNKKRDAVIEEVKKITFEHDLREWDALAGKQRTCGMKIKTEIGDFTFSGVEDQNHILIMRYDNGIEQGTSQPSR